MSVEAMVLALHHSRAVGTTKVILLGIANHHGDGGAWPAIATLADYANIDRSNARKHVAKLEAMGEIRRHVQGGGTRAMSDHERPNRYDILLRCPADCDGTTAHRTRRKASHTPPLDIAPGADSPRGAASLPRGEANSTPEPSSQPSTNTDHESRVGERVRARRADGSTCWALFATTHCVGIGVTGQRHRYSETQGCCPDCGEVPTHRSAS